MMVARTRKKVFQPSVAAKPRHTMKRVRPQPEEDRERRRFWLTFREEEKKKRSLKKIKNYINNTTLQLYSWNNNLFHLPTVRKVLDWSGLEVKKKKKKLPVSLSRLVFWHGPTSRQTDRQTGSRLPLPRSGSQTGRSSCGFLQSVQIWWRGSSGRAHSETSSLKQLNKVHVSFNGFF